jgi:hypothetical protein
VLSVRAYDRDDMMCAAEVIDGAALADTLTRLFREPAPSYIHLHNAKHGCFFCRVERVPA